MGANFVGSKLIVIDGKIQYQVIVLYDGQFEIIKELTRYVSPVQSVIANTELPMHPLNIAIYRDNIYVEKSREGFLIEVYDSEVSLTHVIRKEIKRKSIGRREKKALLDNSKGDPSIKAFGFDNILQQTRLIYPDYLPPSPAWLSPMTDYMSEPHKNMWIRPGSWCWILREMNWVISKHPA